MILKEGEKEEVLEKRFLGFDIQHALPILHIIVKKHQVRRYALFPSPVLTIFDSSLSPYSTSNGLASNHFRTSVIEIESKILFPNYPTLIIKVWIMFLGYSMNMREEQITKKIKPTKALRGRITTALPVIVIIVTAAISTTQFLSTTTPAFAQDVSTDEGVSLDVGGVSIGVGPEDVLAVGDEVGIAVGGENAAGFGDEAGIGIGGDVGLGFGGPAGIGVGGGFGGGFGDESAIGIGGVLGRGFGDESAIGIGGRSGGGFGDELGLGIGGENAFGFGDEAGIGIGGEDALGLANDLGIGIAGEEGIGLGDVLGLGIGGENGL